MANDEDSIDIFRQRSIAAKRKPMSWRNMNNIQRVGVLGFLPFLVPFFACEGKFSMISGLLSWSWLFLGYAAGNLWKYRHVLHFWWSIALAGIVHGALLPIYVSLDNHIKNDRDGKAYIYITAGLMVAELLLLLFVLKRVGMWLYQRTQSPLLLNK